MSGGIDQLGTPLYLTFDMNSFSEALLNQANQEYLKPVKELDITRLILRSVPRSMEYEYEVIGLYGSSQEIKKMRLQLH